jgi:hypothetical protein
MLAIKKERKKEEKKKEMKKDSSCSLAKVFFMSQTREI